MTFTATGAIAVAAPASVGVPIGPSTFSGHLSYSFYATANNVIDVTWNTRGSAALTDSRGDQIKVAITGSSFDPFLGIFIKGPVKGGAGIFKNAAGTFSGSGGGVNDGTGSFTISLTVKLTRL
jgi:hypothetical protein